MENLRKRQLDAVIREAVEKEIPFLGICLGLQVLFEQSEEAPGVEGLGILKGKICRIPNAEGLKIPHMGWNSLHLENNGRLFKGIEDDPYVYFVHSYYLKAEDEQIVKASAEYGVHIHASVEQKNVFACQFHPEKSSTAGLRGIIRGECDVYKENYSLSGCKRRTGRKRSQLCRFERCRRPGGDREGI